MCDAPHAASASPRLPLGHLQFLVLWRIPVVPPRKVRFDQFQFGDPAIGKASMVERN